jgi:hypothetical protein
MYLRIAAGYLVWLTSETDVLAVERLLEVLSK